MPSRLKMLMVKEAAERYRDVGGMVAVTYGKVSAEDATALRRSMREKSIDIRVVRNGVTRLAFEELGRAEFGRLLGGQIAIVSADDVVEASRAAAELARGKGLRLKGGWADGRDLTQEEVQRLAALPGRKALLALVAGLAAAPLRSLVGMLGASGAALARAIGAWNEERGGPGALAPDCGPTPCVGAGGAEPEASRAQ